MDYLLDTDTLIFWMKANPNVLRHVNKHGVHNLAASIISRAELYFGAYRSERVDKNIEAISHLSEKIPFLALEPQADRLFGQTKAHLMSRGTPLHDTDLLIAATAQSKAMILVTNNTKHFERIPGLNIQNWCLEAPAD